MKDIVTFLLLLAALPTAPAHAAMVVRPIAWTTGGVRFQNVLVYDDEVATKRPGLLMVPNWYGINADAIAKAEMIAGRDYVVLLTDVYGGNIHPANDVQAKAAASALLTNRSLLRARMTFGLAQLRTLAAGAPIDTARLAAIGFCFGGAAVLDLARTGADLPAVVSFHGELATDDPNLARNIHARVLAMNGADDTLTSPDFGPFMAEMRQDPAPWRFTVIGHAVHCFTERNATATTGLCRYDASAAAQSYALMRSWLTDAFADRQ
jgi:dienelactone hydrolase